MSSFFTMIKGFLSSTERRFSYLTKAGVTNSMPDERFLQKKYWSVFGKVLNLDNPVTFNEKLQWLKLYDRRPEYTVMADKYRVREYIAEQLGEEYLIPLLGAWEDPEQINFDKLPNQFVLKCNHNSGLGMYICHDKTQMDIKQVKRDLKHGLKQNYYLTGREWPYKDIPRKVICEQFMTNNGEELADYKIHCFNGEPRLILVCRDRFQESGLTEDFFTEVWEHLPVKRPNIPQAKLQIEKPAQLEQMLAFARKLSQGIPFVRVDFYVIDGSVYFGELTFFPASGMAPFTPEDWDETFGSWLQLPDKDGE